MRVARSATGRRWKTVEPLDLLWVLLMGSVAAFNIWSGLEYRVRATRQAYVD